MVLNFCVIQYKNYKNLKWRIKGTMLIESSQPPPTLIFVKIHATFSEKFLSTVIALGFYA